MASTLKMQFIRTKIIILSLLFANSFLVLAIDDLQFTHISADDGLSQNTIHGIVQDKYGFMWFGTWEGICRYDGYSFKAFRAGANEGSGLGNNRTSNLYLDSLKNIWASDGNASFSVYNYNQEKFVIVNSDSVPNYVAKGLTSTSRIYRTVKHGGTEWSISRNRTELIKETAGGIVHRYSKSSFNDLSLSDHNLTDLYIDTCGVLWVGTENNGINKADTRAKAFSNFKNIPFNAHSIIDNVIRAVAEDQHGNLWIGTFNKGVSKVDSLGNYTHYQHQENNSNSLIDNRIRSLFCDHLGDIWIGTKGGLSRFSPTTNTFTSFSRFDQPFIPHNSVFWIMEDHANVLWISTFNGFARYNRTKNQFVSYSSDSLLNHQKVRCMVEDKHHNLWVGTEGGGISILERDPNFQINGKLKKVKAYSFDPDNSQSILSNVVHLIQEDKQGNMWIGTNNGLCKINTETGHVLRMNIESGFPDYLIMGLMFDKQDNAWVSHKKGLTKIMVDKNGEMSFRTFTKSDGLQGNEFSHNAYMQGKVSGKFYFGGSKGLSSFYPDSIRENLFPPKVLISGLRIKNQKVGIGQEIEGRTILSQSMLNTTSIQIDYSMKSIGIEFVGIHYSNPQSNTYQYMLEGFNNNWIEADASHRIANYSNLLPGTYLFKVKAANCDGVWNPIPASLEITVLPPWWRSAGAYLFYVFFVIGMLLLLIRLIMWRENLKRQLLLETLEKEKEQEMNKAKTEFYTLISHELRTPLSLVVDPLDQLVSGNIPFQKQKNMLAMMLQNAKRLQKLLNQLLDFRKLESNKMKVELKGGDIVTVIRQVHNSFKTQSENRNIQLDLVIETPSIICLFDADKLEKIVSNLLSNAIKYTPDNGSASLNVQLKAETSGSHLVIKVSDSGVGIPNKEKKQVFDQFYQIEDARPFEGDSSGLGLSMTRKLIDLWGGQILIKDNHPQGTQFIVSLPITMVENKHISVPEKDESAMETLGHDADNIHFQGLPIVLVVDDNEEIVNYIKEIFARNFRVLTAFNGESGLKIAIREIPDIIISDVMMPGISGFEVCQQLKADQRTSHIPIILLTANASDEAQMEGFGTGADIYHVKPFNSKLLHIQIKNLLANRSILKEYILKDQPIKTNPELTESIEHAFLDGALRLVNENIQNNQFGPDSLADQLNVSKRQLYRKIKALTGQTVHELITNVKMQEAKKLLRSKQLSISEIAYQLGYSESTNFSRSFSKHTGETPSQYQKRKWP